MLRVVIGYGLIAGLLVSVNFFWVLTSDPASHTGSGYVYGYATMIIALTAVFLGIKRYRDKTLGGVIRFGQAVGIGAGQQNRVESGEIAAKKADGRARGGACASDAFYPFPDGVEAAAAAGVAVVVQPGGSVSDEKVVTRADELGLAMVFTGERHFLH